MKTRRTFLTALAAGLLAALVAFFNPHPAPPARFVPQPHRAAQGLAELQRWAGSHFITTGTLRGEEVDEDALADVASVVIGTCIMSLGACETHGSTEQAAEGRALYAKIRDACIPILGREPTLRDVREAPIPASMQWPGVRS